MRPFKPYCLLLLSGRSVARPVHSAFTPHLLHLTSTATFLSMGSDAAGCDDGVCRPKGATANASVDLKGLPTAGKTSKSKLKIEIISDTMCPWCWVGKRNLEKALRETPEIEVEIDWLPFFLDKTLPEPDGKPVEEYYIRNYGDPKVGERFKPHLVKAGEKCGIDFATHYIHLTHYRPTIRSHRLITLAKRQGKQDPMVEELFRMYYEGGKHLNSIEHLTEAARKVGLEGDIEGYLTSDQDEKEVYEEAERYQKYASGVPTFLFSMPEKNLRYSFSGGQPPEAFKNVFQSFLTEQDKN